MKSESESAIKQIKEKTGRDIVDKFAIKRADERFKKLITCWTVLSPG